MTANESRMFFRARVPVASVALLFALAAVAVTQPADADQALTFSGFEFGSVFEGASNTQVSGGPSFASIAEGFWQNLGSDAHRSIQGNVTDSAAHELAARGNEYEVIKNDRVLGGNLYSTQPASVTPEENEWVATYSKHSPDNDSGREYFGRHHDDDFVASLVPEPGMYAMMAAGLGLLVLVARRRPKTATKMNAP